MEYDIDARGMPCPRPLVMTREALAAGRGSFVIIVDNEAARENVCRFARNAGCVVEVFERPDGFLVRVVPGDEAVVSPREDGAAVARRSTGAGKVVFIGSDEIDRGERELGAALAKAFIYACTERDHKLDSVVFMNSGVRLVTENQETVEHLRKLESEGTDIVVCGTCLDFYSLKEKLQVGRVSNMYEIQGILMGADHLISMQPCTEYRSEAVEPFSWA